MNIIPEYIFERNGKEVKLIDFISAIDDKINEYAESQKFSGPHGVFVEKIGSKYIRVISKGQRSVYCFLDKHGNILKAASWAAPAKHIRGSVFDENYSWGAALGPYGASYLK